MNVQMKVHKLRSFITLLLVHMYQKKKIALKIDHLRNRLNFDLNKSGQNISSQLERASQN